MAYSEGYRINKSGCILNPLGKRIKGSVTKGYRKFNLKLDGKDVSVKVHRLVAYQKFGDKIFDPKIQVRHLNGNSLNNTHNNIDIGTAHDNIMDLPAEVRKMKSAIAMSHRKYKIAQLTETE